MTPYFQEDGITIYHGDCREVMPTLDLVDVVITDPPYSEYVHSKSRRGGASAPPMDGSGRKVRSSFSRTKEFGFESLSLELLTFCAGEFARLARRWVLTFSDVESCNLWRDQMVISGLEYVRTGAWVKIGATPQFTGDRPATGFEAITICHPPGRKRWNGGGIHAIWQYPIVLNRNHREPRLHTTQKPLGLAMDLVDLFTNAGETILDAFCGSGTFLVAAKASGRLAVGIEINEQDCEKAAIRVRAEPAPKTIRRWPRKAQV